MSRCGPGVMGRGAVNVHAGRSTKMRLLLLGHGRMGTLVEALAPEYGCEVCGVLDDVSNEGGAGLAPGRWPDVQVAIDFSIASAVEDNVRALAASKINVIIGTTGWDDTRPRIRDIVERSGIGVEGGGGGRRVRTSHRHGLDACRLDSGHAHDRL